MNMNVMTDFGSGYINAVAFYENGAEYLAETNNSGLTLLDLGKKIDLEINELIYYKQYNLQLVHTFLCNGGSHKGFQFVLKDYGIRDVMALYFKLEVNGIVEDNIIYYQTVTYRPKNEIQLCVEYDTSTVHDIRLVIVNSVYHNCKHPCSRFLFGSQEFPCIATSEEITTMERIDREYSRITNKRSKATSSSSKTSYWKEGVYPSWKIYPEAVGLLSWVEEQTKKIKKTVDKFPKDLNDINLHPPKNERAIYIPIECTCDKSYNIKMWLLREHCIEARIISGFDMLQYQIPVSFNNMELLILVHGQHYLEPIYSDLKNVVGNDHSINTNKQLETACPVLQIIKNTEDTVSRNYKEEIVVNSDVYQNFLEAKKNLNLWIAEIYKQAYEQYKSARSYCMWKSEYRLFKFVNLLYPDAIYQYRPNWLAGQSLDIFIPQENCAIEYQGRQHYQALDYFGGESGYAYRHEMDCIKKERCEQNGILLLEWSYTERILFSAVIGFLNKNLRNVQIDSHFVLARLDLEKPILVADEEEKFAIPKTVQKKTQSEEFEIRKYDLTGRLIECYSSIGIASQKSEIAKGQIAKAILGYNHTAGGFQWKKVKRNDKRENIPALVTQETYSSENMSKAVYQIDLNGTVCAEYESIGTAVRATGINRKSIYDALRGRQKTAGGYIWRFKENEE